MVAIVSGNGLGVSLSSLSTLGGSSSTGGATQGHNGELAFVNIANGNLILQDHDATQSALGAIPLDSLRVYNSEGTLDATDNWSNGFSMRKLAMTVGTVNAVGSVLTRTDTDGATSTYTFSGGVYTCTQGGGAYDTITWNATTSTYTRVDTSTGATEKYDASGKLLSLADAKGMTLTFAYNSAGLVTSVKDNAGVVRTYYDYDASNRLSQIRTVSAGGVVTSLVHYGFDAYNRLSTVKVDLTPADSSITDNNVYTTTYNYVSTTSKQLQSVVQGDGSSLTFAYVVGDPTFRLQSITDNLGNKTSFAYDATNRKTTVTDANSQSTVYSYDANGQLLSIAVPSAAGTATTSYAYNTNGDLTQVTDASGRAVLMTYDANGNQLSQMDAAGNTVTRTYDANKQLATETAYVVPDPDGTGSAQPGSPMTTRYVYDAASGHQLRFVITPEGRVTQYVYNATNQRASTITYPTAAYAVGGLAQTAVPTEAQMTTWLAGLSQTDLTQSVRSDVVYDAVGNVSQITAFAKVDNTGVGVSDGTQSITKYVYDQYGHLLQLVKPGTGTTTFTYDGLGRVLTKQDANGTATTTYDGANRKVVATSVNGLITTSLFDPANRLVSVAQGTSSATLGTSTLAYDADGNLLMTTDPDGNRTFALYDAAGRKVATIDPTGFLTETVYNLAGQVVETIRYATAVSLSSLVDSTGKVLNPALSAIRPTGASYVSWTLYDTAGRVSKQIDAGGYVTETRYDGASRVTDVIQYANAVALSGITTATLATAVAPTADANNDRRVRTFYDNDGNATGQLDAEGYLTETVYDAAGRALHTIAYAVATAAANRATGTLATLRPATDAHDIHGWNYYNDQSQLIGSVDGEGYLTEYTYDADGHVIKTVRHAALALVAPTAITAATTLTALRPTVTTGDQVTQAAYNALGQLTSTTSAEGSVTQYVYDTAGNLVTSTVAAGTTDVRIDTRKYDVQGHVVSELTGVGNAALAALGASPTAAQISLVWTTYATNYTYDSAGLRTSAVDPVGNKTLYYYDADGRSTHTVNAAGEVEERTYNVLGQLVATTKIATRLSAATLATLTGGLDTAALLTAITSAKNATLDSKVSFTYLAQGLVGTQTDELGDLTTYTYNAFGQSVQASQATGGTNLLHKVDYDRRGQVKDTKENTDDEATILVHDAFGRLVSTTDPTGAVTSTSFDRLGRATQVTGPLFVQSQTQYDAFGRALQVKDANGNATTYAYNDVARTMTMTDKFGVSVTRSHDREGESISILDGDGNTTTYAYDADGHLKDTVVDPGNNHLALDTHTDYDAAGRIAGTVDAAGNKVTYQYDAANRVFKRIEGNNASVAMNITTTYTYDGKGQLITQQDPNNILTSITYDLGGNVLTKTVDTAGLKLKTTNTYDVRGNLLTTTDASGVVTTYAYNTLGRRSSAQVDGTLKLTTQYGYDADGNVTRVIDPDGNVTLNAYDKAGRLIYTQDGAGNVTGQTYDNDGHVLTVTHFAKPQTALVPTVTASGLVTIAVSAPTATAGLDQTTTYTYDTNGNRTLAEVDKAGLDLKTQYFYDGAGNVTKIVDPNGAATLYIYDAANRVTSTLSAAGTLTQTAYDADGHVAQTTVYSGAKTMTTTVASNGRVTNTLGAVTASPNDVTTKYAYDADNRRISATVDSSGLALKTAYAYDAAGNLTQATDPAGKITYYGYDAAGRRRYTLDPQNILTEMVYDGANRVTATIVYASAPTGLSATPNAVGLVTPTFTVVGSATLDRVTRYAYDAAGRQVYAVDALGNVTETARDAAGLVTGVRRYVTPITLPAAGAADGRTLAMTTAAIKAAIVANAADLITRYAYDAAGRKVFSVDAFGAVTGYTYDAFGQVAIKRAYVATVTQPAWGTTFTAAAITTALGAANPADRLTRFGYDNAGRTIYVVDALGVVTASVYDPDGHVIKTQVYHGAIALPTDGSALTGAAITSKLAASAGTDAVTRYAYDADGHQVYVVDAMGFATLTTYDAQGRVRAKTAYATAITLPSTAGATMSVADITAALHPSAATDQVTRYVVDDAGRTTWTIDAVGQVTAYAYDKDGNVTQQTAYSKAINNGTLALVVNAGDFTVTAVAATDRVTRYFYDNDSRLRFTIDPLGYATEVNYQADRVVTTQYAVIPTVTATAVTADVASACTSIASTANDHTTTVVQDKDGRSTDTTTPDKVVSRDVYDPLGRVVTHIDAVGLPEQLTTTYAYDAAGRVVNKTVGAGTAAAQTTLTNYDAFGEIDKVVSPDGYALGYLDTAWAQAERSRLGMPTAAASLTPAQRTELLARYTTKFTYDADGRALTTVTSYLSSTAAATSTTTSTAYDVFGNAVKVTDPLGNIGYFYFDKLGRVVMQVDPLLNVVQTVYTGGFSDKVASVRRYANKAPAGTTEAALPTVSTNALDVVTTYAYDKLGRVVSTVNASGTTDQSTESVTWQSSDGNVFNKVVTNKLSGATTYVYDRDGNETSEALPVGVTNSFLYDAFGNRTQSIEAAGLPEQRTTYYKYDAMGRVVYRIGTAYQAFSGFNADGSVKTVSASPVDYTHYDALGRVIETLTSANWSGTAASGGVRTLTYYDNVGNQVMTIAADGAVTRNTFTTSGKVWQSYAYATTIALPSTAGGTPPAPTVDAANDRVHTYKYDALDRLVETDLDSVIYWQQTNPTGAIVLNLPSSSPQTVVLSKTVYDAAGNAVQQTDGRGNSSYTYYDAVGRKILAIDAGGYATSWDYADVFDTATQQTQYSTQLASSNYVGQPLTAAKAASLRSTLDATAPASTAPNRVNVYTLDRQGRVHEHRLLAVAYDYVGADGSRFASTVDDITDFTYDALGDITEQSDRVAKLADNVTNVWNVTDYTYDKLGRVTNEKDPGYTDYTGAAVRPSTDTVYDGLGNVVRTVARSTDNTDANSRITANKYDANGNLVQTTDANGNVTQYLYDFNLHIGLTISLGQQSASGTLTGVLDGTTKFLGVQNADGAGATYIKYFAYDATGRQLTQTDKATGQVTNTRYNAFGEITGKGLGTDKNTGLPAYQEFSGYNVMGKVERSNTGDGVTKLYLYDLDGNATQQIQSSTADLTAVSIVTAATDTSLQHTFSIYDSRNNLTRTVEPDISFYQDQITSQAAYSEQLTDPYGAITVGESAGGTYATGSVDANGFGYTQVGGESGSTSIPGSATAAVSNTTDPTPTTSATALGMPNLYAFPLTWGGRTGLITSITLPATWSAALNYRIVYTNTQTVISTPAPGTSGAIASSPTGVDMQIQASCGDMAWTTVATLYNEYQPAARGEPASILHASAVVLPYIVGGLAGVSVDAYVNYGTPSQANSFLNVLGGSELKVINPGSPVTLIWHDASGMRMGAVATWDASGVMTLTQLPAAQVWTPANQRTPNFSSSVIATSGATTLYYRVPVPGTDWTPVTLSGNVADLSGLANNQNYEYILSSNQGEFYGTFTTGGAGQLTLPQTQLSGVTAPLGFAMLSQRLTSYNPQVKFDLSGKLGSVNVAPPGGFVLDLNINGNIVEVPVSGNVAYVDPHSFGLALTRYVHVGPLGYTYTVYAVQAGGRQFIGQGTGTMTLGGSDFAQTNTSVPYYQPRAYLTLPSSNALSGTLNVGGINIGVNSGDWRVQRTSDGSNPVLSVDLSQFLGQNGVTISYSAGDAVFNSTYNVSSDGTVTLVSKWSQARQPMVPITVSGATTLSVLRVGPNDGSLGDVPTTLISTSGSTFTWDASAQAGKGAQRFYYEARDASGVIGMGYGWITVAADGSLTYNPDPPLLKPSSMTFTPPTTATTFTLHIYPHGSTVECASATYPNLTPGQTVTYTIPNALRPGSGATDYDFVYLGTDVNGKKVSGGNGVLTVKSDGTTKTTYSSDRAPLVLQGPTGENVGRMEIDLKLHGSASAPTQIFLVGTWNESLKCSVFSWDLTGLQTTAGPVAYDYTMSMQNANGTPFLNEIGNPISINGVMTLGVAGSSAVSVQQYVTQLNVPAQVTHNQLFDAFGEISSEYDDATLQRANAAATMYHETGVDASAVQTTFIYNTEGKLIQKIDPQTSVTLANGFQQRVRPVTTYGYDLEGRLVTTLDANGNLSRENYAGAGNRVSQQWAADGGHKEVDYDIFGSERKDTDELGVVTNKIVDKMGNLTEADIINVTRVANDTGSNKVNSTITDLYVVDAFGQRIKHTNAMLGVDRTYYDSLGRVIKTVTAAGRATTYAYTFVPFNQNPGITGNGQKSIGGYQLVTTNADGTTTTDNINYFGVTTWHVDEGGHSYMYIYDVAGHLAQQTSSAGQNIYYAYYANGDLKEERDVVMKTMTRYGYDNAGNRVWEQYSGLDATLTNPISVYQSSTLVYDEVDRLIRVQDVAVDIQYQFDAVGNRRNVHAVYWDGLANRRQLDDLWYTYDAVNRFTMTKGSMTGHATSATDTSAYIVRGLQGVSLTYDLRGERKTATNPDNSVETYNYSADGFLEDTLISGVLRSRRRVDALGRTFEYLEYTAASVLMTDQTSTYDGDGRLQATGDLVNKTSTKYYYFLDKTNNQGTAAQAGAGALAHVDLTPTTGSGTSTIYTYDYWESARQTTIKTQVIDKSNPNNPPPTWATGMSQLSYDVDGYLHQAYDNASGRTLTYINSAHGLVITRVDMKPGKPEVDDYWYYANDHMVGDVSTDATENATRTSYAEQLAITEANGKEAKDSHKKNAPAAASQENVDFDQNYQPINSGYPAATGTAYTVHNGDTLKSIAKNIWGDASMWYLIAQTNNLTGSETLVQGQILQIPNKVANIHNNADTFRPYNPGEVIGDINPTLPDPPPPASPDKGCGTIGTIIMVVVAVVVTIYTAGAAAELMGAALSAGGTTMGLGASVLAGGLGAGVATTAVSTGVALAAAAIGGAVGSIASQAIGDAMGNTHGFSWKQVALAAVGSAVTAGVGEGLNAAFPAVNAAPAANAAALTPQQAFTQGAERFAMGVATSVGSSAVEQALKGEWSWRQIAASAVGSAAGQGAASAMSAAMGNMIGASMASKFASGMASGWAQSAVMAGDPRNPKARLSSLFANSLGSAIGETISDEVQAAGVERMQQGLDQSDSILQRKFDDANFDQHGIEQSDAILQRKFDEANFDQHGVEQSDAIQKQQLADLADSKGFDPSTGALLSPSQTYGTPFSGEYIKVGLEMDPRLTDDQVAAGMGAVQKLRAGALPLLALAGDLSKDKGYAQQVIDDLNTKHDQSIYYTAMSAPTITEYKLENVDDYARLVLSKASSRMDLADQVEQYIGVASQRETPATPINLVDRAIATGNWQALADDSSVFTLVKRALLGGPSNGGSLAAYKFQQVLVDSAIVPYNEAGLNVAAAVINRGTWNAIKDSPLGQLAQLTPLGALTVNVAGLSEEVPSAKLIYAEAKELLKKLPVGEDLRNPLVKKVLEEAVTVAFKAEDKIQSISEDFIPKRMRAAADSVLDRLKNWGGFGELVFGTVLAMSGLYRTDSIGALQNPSGHGVDLFAQRTTGMNKGQWDVFEIKTSDEGKAGTMNYRQYAGPYAFANDILGKAIKMVPYWTTTSLDSRTYAKEITSDMATRPKEDWVGFLVEQNYINVPTKTSVNITKWENKLFVIPPRKK